MLRQGLGVALGKRRCGAKVKVNPAKIHYWTRLGDLIIRCCCANDFRRGVKSIGEKGVRVRLKVPRWENPLASHPSAFFNYHNIAHVHLSDETLRGGRPYQHQSSLLTSIIAFLILNNFHMFHKRVVKRTVIIIIRFNDIKYRLWSNLSNFFSSLMISFIYRWNNGLLKNVRMTVREVSPPQNTRQGQGWAIQFVCHSYVT